MGGRARKVCVISFRARWTKISLMLRLELKIGVQVGGVGEWSVVLAMVGF